MNQDYSDILSAFIEEGVRFLLVGAHALAAHGLPRATGDLDLWIESSDENAAKAWRALARFGAPLEGIQKEDFRSPGIVFQIGVAPRRIDILTSIDGVEFDRAWKGHVLLEIEGLSVPVIGREDLAVNKRASGRPQDLADLAWLERDDS